MPIFGNLRKQDPHLSFGQYLTVLKRWFEDLRKEKEDFERELREKLNGFPKIVEVDLPSTLKGRVAWKQTAFLMEKKILERKRWIENFEREIYG